MRYSLLVCVCISIIRGLAQDLEPECELELFEINECVQQATSELDSRTIDGFCELLQEAGAQCVAHVESNCSQVLEYQNLLRVYIDMFGCGYEREDGSMYSTPRGECDFLRTLRCYDPVFNILTPVYALSPMSRTVNIADYAELLRELDNQTMASSLLGNSPTEWSNICSANVDWASVRSCVLPYFLVCEPLINSYLPNNPAAGNAPPVDNITSIVAYLTVITERLTPFCDSGCQNAGASLEQYNQCVDDVSLVSLDPNSFETDAYPVCSDVRHIADCARRNMMDCDLASQEFYREYSNPIYQQFFDDCDVNIRTSTISAPLRCDNEEFRESEKRMINECLLHPTYFGYGQKSIDETCRALNEEIECLLRHIRCCEHFDTELQPRLHLYAVYNQLFDCNIGMVDRFNRYLGSWHVQSTGECDYSELFGCYEELFEAAGITNIAPGGEALLDQIEELNEFLSFRFNITTCRPLQEIDFDDIATCRDAVLQECPHPRTCAFRDPVSSAGNPIDLIDFDTIRRDFEALCTPECEEVFMNEGEETCNEIALSPEVVARKIIWRDMIGKDTGELCRSFENVAQCIEDGGGSCQAIVNFIASVLEGSKWEIARGLAICGENYFDHFIELPLENFLDEDKSHSPLHKQNFILLLCSVSIGLVIQKTFHML